MVMFRVGVRDWSSCFDLFCSVLFCSVLFCFVLFFVLLFFSKIHTFYTNQIVQMFKKIATSSNTVDTFFFGIRVGSFSATKQNCKNNDDLHLFLKQDFLLFYNCSTNQ